MEGEGQDQAGAAAVAEPDEDKLLREQAEKRVEEKLEFRTHLVVYLVVNSVIFAVWLVIALTAGGDAWWPWFLFPLLGWGIGLSLHAWGVYGPQSTRREAMVQQEMDRIKKQRAK